MAPFTRRRLLARAGIGAAGAFALPYLDRAVFAATGARRMEGVDSPELLRLDGTGNAYGPASEAVAAAQAIATSARWRLEDEVPALVERIARLHGVETDRIVLGCGSTEILRAAIDVYARPSKTVLSAFPTFPTVRRIAEAANVDLQQIALASDQAHDLRRMLDHVGRATGVVYICNPNNPTGSVTRHQDVDAFLDRLPRATRVVIDEAYFDYVGPSSDYASFASRVAADRRLIVLRTFSKVHGLAGLRVGYAIAAPSTARSLRTASLADGVSAIAARAAVAALDATDYVQTSVARNCDDRQEFFNQANARMLGILDSRTNFVMLNVEANAAAAVEHFRQNGIVLPAPFEPLTTYVRVKMGTLDEMARFWRTWDRMPGRPMKM